MTSNDSGHHGNHIGVSFKLSVLGLVSQLNMINLTTVEQAIKDSSKAPADSLIKKPILSLLSTGRFQEQIQV